MKQMTPLIALLLLSACGLFQPRVPDSGPRFLVKKPATVAPSGLQGLGQNGISVTVLDQATPQQVAAPIPAAGASATGKLLGEVTVALGSPTEQGFWLKSNLVKTPTKGRVVLTSGQSVAVDLQPSDSGALMSFAAYRALGLTLTDLPRVQVLAN